MTGVWCTCPFGHPGMRSSGQNEDKVQVSIINHLFPEARGPGVKMSSASGVEYIYDSFIQLFLPGPSLVVSCSRKIINSLSLTGRMYALRILRNV